LRRSLALAGVALIISTTAVYADGISVDNDLLAMGVQSTVDLTAEPDAAVATSAQLLISWSGSKHLSAGTTVTLSNNSGAGGTSLPGGYSVSTVNIPRPATWVDGTIATGTSNISFTAPSTAGDYTYVVKWNASGFTCSSSPCLTGNGVFNINLTVEEAANTAPAIGADNASVEVTEGDTATNSGTVSDADGDPVSLSASVGSVTDNGDGTWSWSWDTVDGPADSQTVTITADDGTDTSTVDFDLTVDNADPVVAAPAFSSTSVDCGSSVDLTGISFSDAGLIDYDWTVAINWGDGNTDQATTSSQGAQSDASHTYGAQGTYTATVGVTDKDGGYGEADSSNTVFVNGYAVTFLAPFDGSTQSHLITNTMKSGRVVPVKVVIYDLCNASYVNDPTEMVKIVVRANGSGSVGSNDAVEVYADAGASNSNTLYFRWSADPTVAGGGFWIYNLDSRTAIGGNAMLVGTCYRIDVMVNGEQATNSTWAFLKPVK